LSSQDKPVSYARRRPELGARVATLDEEAFLLAAPYLPAFEFLLDDISQKEDEELRARAMTDLSRLTLLCLRSLLHSPHPIEDLRRWLDLCLAVLNATDGTLHSPHWQAIFSTPPTPNETSSAHSPESSVPKPRN
jgi:hypothetical protein